MTQSQPSPALHGVDTGAKPAAVFRVLDAWSAARTIASCAHEAAESLYAAYWLTGSADGALHVRERARKELANIRKAVASLEAAMGDA